MNTTKEKIAVMQAYEDGKKIQSRSWNPSNIVQPAQHSKGLGPELVWNWQLYSYEVVREPQAVYGILHRDRRSAWGYYTCKILAESALVRLKDNGREDWEIVKFVEELPK